MAKNKPKKQHFVPQMILKNFTDDDNLLRYFDKSTGEIEERTPKGTFWKRNLYTRRVNGGNWGDWDAEDKLATIENDAEPIFRTILDAAAIGIVPMLSPENQAICHRFYIYMVHRNPTRATEMLHEMGVDDIIYEAVCRALKQAGIPVPDRNVFDNAGGFDEIFEKLKHNNQASFSAGISPQIDRHIEKFIANLSIFIGVAKDPATRLIIGDCGVTRDEEDENRAFGWLPIAPNVAISVRPDSGKVHFLDMDVDQVQAVNDATWSQSNIVAAKCVTDLDPFIREQTKLAN